VRIAGVSAVLGCIHPRCGIEYGRMKLFNILSHWNSGSSTDIGLNDLQLQLAELVLRITHRDQIALAELRRLVTPALLVRMQVFFKGSLKGKFDELEVLNQVYLQVWQKSHQYDVTRGPVMRWLTVICVGRTIDHFRKARSWARGDDLCGLTVGIDADLDRSPEETLLASQDELDVTAAIGRLSPLRKQLVTMAFLQELTHAEIAAQTHMALGTVKSHIRRALNKLRAEMLPSVELR
jgi:RNA polymerase sigma factor (sigma-70 family)